MNRLEYRIIQFSRNPMREEGRNIGVIAFDGTWAGFRSIGMFGGLERPDLYSFLSIVGADYRESLWVFGEWIEWFKALCIESEGARNKINEELDGLNDHSPHLTATQGGYYEMAEERPEIALDELFNELVGQPLIPAKGNFRDDVYQTLVGAEITHRPEFDEGVEITIETDEVQPPVVVTLDYFLEADKRVGFKVIRFQNAKTASLGAKVNDAIYTFTEAQKSGFLDKERCVVLCDTPSVKREVYVERLQSVATVIDVTKQDAHRRVANICPI